MGKRSLPPGFRFHPTDVELVRYYLKRKVAGKKLHFEAIAEIDIYKYAPWDLPDKSLLRSGDLKWYFFCPREKKYASGARMNRATSFGYWKTTGKDRCVHYKDEVAGMIKTLVFHSGKAPKGDRTDWVMYEYRLEDKELADIQHSYVLSVIFKKEGPGPRNGAQYGAPFNEEEWDDDDDNEEVTTNDVGCLSFAGGLTPPTVLPMNETNSIITNSHVPVSVCKESSVSTPSEKLPPLNSTLIIGSDIDTSARASQLLKDGDGGSYAGISGPPSLCPITQCNPSGIKSSLSYPSEILPSAAKSLCLFSDNDVPCTKNVDLPEDDELLSMLDSFYEEHDKTENASDQKFGGNFDADSWLDDVDFFNGLGQFTVDGTTNCYNTNDAVGRVLQGGDGHYLELTDLEAPLSFPMEACGYEQVPSRGLYGDNNSHCPPNPGAATHFVTGLDHSPMLPESYNRSQDQMNAFSKEKANYGFDVHDASLFKDITFTRLNQDMGSGCPFDAGGDMFGGVAKGLPTNAYMEKFHR